MATMGPSGPTSITEAKGVITGFVFSMQNRQRQNKGSCQATARNKFGVALHEVIRHDSYEEGADLATTEVATTSPPEIATTRTYIHQI